MGNLAGSETSRAQALSDKELKSRLKLDQEYSQITNELWDPTFLSSMKEIDSYEVPGHSSR
jgi:hypothetical protein